MLARLTGAGPAAAGTGIDDGTDCETPIVLPSRRERQMSFSLPERSIIQQTNVSQSISAQPMSSQRKSYQNMLAAAAAAAAAAAVHSQDITVEEVERHRHIARRAADMAKVRAASLGVDDHDDTNSDRSDITDLIDASDDDAHITVHVHRAGQKAAAHGGEGSV